MGSWGDVLEEIKREKVALEAPPHGRPPSAAAAGAADIVRRKYLSLLAAHTGRNAIVYASGWLQKTLPAEVLAVHPSDMDGFLEVVKHCEKAKPLDLILHSPGGSPEAAEQIMSYLRQKFTHIRVIVPVMAMSAATMMACGADEVMLARHSTLGPTDPQMAIRSNTGELRLVAAHALKDDFRSAQKAGASGFSAWAPILGQYRPGLLAECEMALKLTRRLVSAWLETYMFKGHRDAKKKATHLANFFADKKHFTHGRPLMRDALSKAGLKVVAMEDDQQLQDLVMSVYHATTHTLGGTTAGKVIDSHAGKGYFKAVTHMQVPHQQ